MARRTNYTEAAKLTSALRKLSAQELAEHESATHTICKKFAGRRASLEAKFEGQVVAMAYAMIEAEDEAQGHDQRNDVAFEDIDLSDGHKPHANSCQPIITDVGALIAAEEGRSLTGVGR
jgi:hypothetical protein